MRLVTALCPGHPHRRRRHLHRDQRCYPQPPAGAVHLGRMQLLPAGRPLAVATAQRFQRFRRGATGVPCGLLGPAGLEGPVRAGRLQPAPARPQQGAGLGLHAAAHARRRGLPQLASRPACPPARNSPPRPASRSPSRRRPRTHIDTQTEIRLAPAAGRNPQLYLALTENNLTSTVTAGENSRRTLYHDYVVRELAGPFDASRVSYRFTLHPDWKAVELGIVAFVTDTRGATLQALARPACP